VPAGALGSVCLAAGACVCSEVAQVPLAVDRPAMLLESRGRAPDVRFGHRLSCVSIDDDPMHDAPVAQGRLDVKRCLRVAPFESGAILLDVIHFAFALVL